LTHLLPHIHRDALDGRLHCEHHALGLLETIQACLAKAFVLGKGVCIALICSWISPAMCVL